MEKIKIFYKPDVEFYINELIYVLYKNKTVYDKDYKQKNSVLAQKA